MLFYVYITTCLCFVYLSYLSLCCVANSFQNSFYFFLLFLFAFFIFSCIWLRSLKLFVIFYLNSSSSSYVETLNIRTQLNTFFQIHLSCRKGIEKFDSIIRSNTNKIYRWNIYFLFFNQIILNMLYWRSIKIHWQI